MYRIGKKQKRAILTADGKEVVVFPKGKEALAEKVCNLLNAELEVNKISSNGMLANSLPSEEYEPYFGWCDVDGCENEGCSGGMAWRETGYWTVCSKHSQMNREGKKQPKMKQTAIDKEKTRKPDGTLP